MTPFTEEKVSSGLQNHPNPNTAVSLAMADVDVEVEVLGVEVCTARQRWVARRTLGEVRAVGLPRVRGRAMDDNAA